MTRAEIAALFELPFFDLLHRAHAAHLAAFPGGGVELATLLSIKTGGCSEDCGYCAQSARYDTPVESQRLMDTEAVLAEARRAADSGATRFCMGAAWRSLADRDLPAVEDMVRGVKALGLETCVTLGMMNLGQARRLREAGLDYYNHNLDTSREYYPQVVGTRTYDDRVETLGAVRAAGLKVCSGGILGLGESRSDRVGLLHELNLLEAPPESVPINRLVPIPGTPLEGKPLVDDFEFVRTVAAARILFPLSRVRLSAGREGMDDSLQALCFYAGANSIFYGERLLTAGNPRIEHDRALLARLDLRPEAAKAEGAAQRA